MSSSSEKLIYMANQIGRFFASQGPDKVATGTAEHIRKFWDPRMREMIFRHIDKGGAGLDPEVRKGIALLRETAASQG
jgi:formate dehydrogenase subunit delta